VVRFFQFCTSRLAVLEAVPAVPRRNDARAFPAVELARLGSGPCVMEAVKGNMPADSASQLGTRISRMSSPALMVCAPMIRVTFATPE